MQDCFSRTFGAAKGWRAPLCGLAILLVPTLTPCPAAATPVTLNWSYASSGAAGFRLYCGTASRNYTVRRDAGNTSSYVISSLQEGATWYCAVTAYDASGAESSYSNETSIYVPYSGSAGSTYSFWSGSPLPANADEPDGNPVNLGVSFQSTQAGFVTGIRFYRSAANVGPHVVTLWNGSGQKLAQATASNETASGWQVATFDARVPIAANTLYVASYFAPAGHYANDNGFFGQALTSGPLVAPASGASGGNGLYTYASGVAFPTQSYRSTNYWVDVQFQPGP
jgi:hypothetical protein